MAINQRGILGPVNPSDDGVKANYVNGDEPVAAKDDQASSMIGSHGDLEAAFKSTYAKHMGGGVQSGAGSEGIPLGGGGADYGFSTSDEAGPEGRGDMPSDASGAGKGIAGELPLVKRADGGDSGIDGTGRTVG